MADINKDYGRRHYLSDRDYQEQMRETTDFAVDSRMKLPHSEFKKPWAEDEYPIMEYAWDPPGFNPPGFPPWPDDIPDPGDPGTTIVPGDPWNPGGPGLGCLFYVPLTPGLLDPGETAFAKLARRDDPIVKVEVDGPAELVSNAGLLQLCTAAGQGTAESVLGHGNPSSAECVIVIKVNDELTDEEQSATILFVDVTATTRSGETCQTSAIVNQENCVDAAAVAYDWDNSAETVDQDDAVLVYVTDGVPPFTWSVSGTGYSITAETMGRANWLRASATACGTAVITVVDSCGDSDTGDVRNTTGTWNRYLDLCELALPDPNGVTNGWQAGTNAMHYIQYVELGGARQWQQVNMVWGGNDGGEGSFAECEANKCNDMGSYTGTPCMPLESSFVRSEYPHDPEYPFTYCGGNLYAEECHQEGGGGWIFREVWVDKYGAPDESEFEYYADLWECS